MSVDNVSTDMIGSCIDPQTKLLTYIYRYSIYNAKSKMTLRVITYGASIHSLEMPSGNASPTDVVVGYDMLDEFTDGPNHYFGATIGRVCNVISNAHFYIGNQHIRLTRNSGPHHMNGGRIGFNKMCWKVLGAHPDGVTFFHISANGNEGYPGELHCTVRYTLSDEGCVTIKMTATTKVTTVVNMSNHTYFNLAGHTSGKKGLYEHQLTILSDRITQTNSEKIPTGNIVEVRGTPFDFRREGNIGRCLGLLPPHMDGYDVNYCVSRPDKKPSHVQLVARVFHPPSGRSMEVLTNQPCLHFYTGNDLPDIETGSRPLRGKQDARYGRHGGFCLMSQKIPDAPHNHQFPPILLKPGETYEHVVIYKFSVSKDRPPAPLPLAMDTGPSTSAVARAQTFNYHPSNTLRRRTKITIVAGPPTEQAPRPPKSKKTLAKTVQTVISGGIPDELKLHKLTVDSEESESSNESCPRNSPKRVPGGIVRRRAPLEIPQDTIMEVTEEEYDEEESMTDSSQSLALTKKRFAHPTFPFTVSMGDTDEDTDTESFEIVIRRRAKKTKVEPPKALLPKAESPKAESPKAESPKAESPKAKTPKLDSPKAESSKAESPKAKTPKLDSPKAESSKAESSKTESSKTESIKYESLKDESPNDESLKDVSMEVSEDEATEFSERDPSESSTSSPFEVYQMTPAMVAKKDSLELARRRHAFRRNSTDSAKERRAKKRNSNSSSN